MEQYVRPTMEQWVPLALKITNRFFNLYSKQDIRLKGKNTVNTQEYCDALFGLMQACQAYDPNYRTKEGRSVKFYTYAWSCIVNKIIRGRVTRKEQRRLQKKAQKRAGLVVISAIEKSHEITENLPETDLPIELLKVFFEEREGESVASKRCKSILYDYYIKELTLEELGKQHDISRERIRQLVNKGLEVIRRQYAKIIAQGM